MKRNIGASLALYPSPLVVVGAMVEGKPTWTLGEHGAPLIDAAKVSIECEVDGNYELEHFDQFICKVLAVYAEEQVLNERGKINYHVFKPVLFEFPTYEYFVTGEKVGNCGRMN